MKSGREVLLEVLATEGVRYIFGNPGTTELPLMDELSVRPDFEYMLALQENVAVAMADGYAQASKRPAFVNLHTAAGLGGGLGNLFNAWVSKTPLVVTAGQQDQRHLIGDPLLAGELTAMAAPVSKWQHEVRSLRDLAPIMRRAFASAASPPTGPVFVSLPMDVLEDQDVVHVPERSNILQAGPPSGVDAVAERLAAVDVGKLALIVGDEVASASALAEVVEIAELLCADVYGAPLHGCHVFPTDHPQWKGALHPVASAVRDVAHGYHTVFLVGAKAILVSPFSTVGPFPEQVEVIHASEDVSEIGRTHRAHVGLAGQLQPTLRALRAKLVAVPWLQDRSHALAELRQQRARRDREADARAMARYAAQPIDPMAAAHAMLRALPEDGILVDEAVTTSIYLRHARRTAAPDSYYACRGGGLGWAMPAALGIKLAQPDRPVLAVVGDGSAMYAVQALWTAARHGIGVTFVVVNNREYAILKRGLAGMRRTPGSPGPVAMDLQPPIDYVNLAKSLGLPAARVDAADAVGDAVRDACAAGSGPSLLEVPIRSVAARLRSS
jgi:benzoylformate decarboxylase